jgi:hypothetical protein
MKKIQTYRSFLLCMTCFLIVAVQGFCQGPKADTAFAADARKNAQKVYSTSIAEQNSLYNGVEYKEYVFRPDDIGNPFFISDDWSDGTVVYDSGVYEHVGILYDLLTDKLIIEQPYSFFKLELISEKVKLFVLQGHTFVRLVGTGKSDSTVRSGFYDRLYNGKVKAYARHSKFTKETVRITGVLVEFLDKNSYYIYKDGKYHSVKSKASVLHVFRDRKKTLRRLIKKNKIKFGTDREGALAKVAQLYDESAE